MKFQQRSGEGYQTEKKGRDKEGKMKIVGKYRLFKKSDFINMYVWQRLKGQQDQSKAGKSRGPIWCSVKPHRNA